MTDERQPENGSLRSAVMIVAGIATVVGGFFLYRYFSKPPQMGTSEEAFRTVDALYTAVRSRDEEQVTQCERRLKEYRDAGHLPPKAADALDAIIKRTRSGDWDSAAERLYDFMLAQRREPGRKKHTG